MLFGELLKTQRKKKKLSQSDLCELVSEYNISKSHVSDYEKDKVAISFSKAWAIAMALEMDKRKAIKAILNSILNKENSDYCVDSIKLKS